MGTKYIHVKRTQTILYCTRYFTDQNAPCNLLAIKLCLTNYCFHVCSCLSLHPSPCPILHPAILYILLFYLPLCVVCRLYRYCYNYCFVTVYTVSFVFDHVSCTCVKTDSTYPMLHQNECLRATFRLHLFLRVIGVC